MACVRVNLTRQKLLFVSSPQNLLIYPPHQSLYKWDIGLVRNARIPLGYSPDPTVIALMTFNLRVRLTFDGQWWFTKENTCSLHLLLLPGPWRPSVPEWHVGTNWLMQTWKHAIHNLQWLTTAWEMRLYRRCRLISGSHEWSDIYTR